LIFKKIGKRVKEFVTVHRAKKNVAKPRPAIVYQCPIFVQAGL